MDLPVADDEPMYRVAPFDRSDDVPSDLFQRTRPPKMLTEREQIALLRAAGQHRDGWRDCVILSLALGTGLRQHEILALNVSDVVDDAGRVRRRVPLRVFKRSNPNADMQVVRLPDAVRAKIDKLLTLRRRMGEEFGPDTPLFVSRNHRRLSARQLRRLFVQWQKRAGLERTLPFHATRHAACSALYRRTNDLRLVQIFARHRSPLSTAIYTHPSEDDLERALRDQLC
jgi:integrase/recombinase XerC